MTNFVEALTLEALAPGTGTTVSVGGKKIAVYNVAGEIYAMGDTCAHAGASLGWGKLEGGVVTCRAHGLKYNVKTGQVTSGGFGVPSYPTQVVEGKILICVD